MFKKLLPSLLFTAAFFVPSVSFAAINTINGIGGTAQTLATTTGTTTMHMKIVSSGSSHTFQWDNSPWRLDQGGTGATTFTSGSVLFGGASSILEDNSNFFWDAVNHFLGIGNKTPTSALDVKGEMHSELVPVSGTSINWNQGNVQKITLTTNTTLTFTGAHPGGEYKLIVAQDNAGNHSVAWPSSITWANNTVPTLSTTPYTKNLVNFVYDGTDYMGYAITGFASTTNSSSGIVFDGTSLSFCGSVCSSQVWDHYISSGSNRTVFVACVTTANTNPITSITYASTSMNFITGTTYNPSRYIVSYYLNSPPIGTSTIDVELNSTAWVTCWASSYSGVSQTATIDNSTTNGASSAVSVSTSLTPSASGSWIMSFAGGDRVFDSWTGATQRSIIENGFGISDSNGIVSGNHTTTYSVTSPVDMGIISWSFAPAN